MLIREKGLDPLLMFSNEAEADYRAEILRAGVCVNEGPAKAMPPWRRAQSCSLERRNDFRGAAGRRGRLAGGIPILSGSAGVEDEGGGVKILL